MIADLVLFALVLLGLCKLIELAVELLVAVLTHLKRRDLDRYDSGSVR